MNRSLRIVGLAVAAAIAILVAIPAVHLARTWLADRPTLPSPPAGHADDASHLNPTRVSSLLRVSADEATATRQIREAYARARAEKRGVSIAGFRHSMGGQTIATDGIVLDMLAHDHTHYDRKTHLLTVGAGATWDLIVPYLDNFGRSVEVMQSDSPFTVGGSVSVNCHGWQPGRPPIASTVQSLTILTPDGRLQSCSRQRNPELFAAAIGGYGMFGVILDVTLRTVPNQIYQSRKVNVAIDQYESRWEREVAKGNAGLAYGRLSVAPGTFLEEAIINLHTPLPGEPPTLEWEDSSALERLLFRGQLRSDFGKRLRWWSERRLAPLIHPKRATRNHLLDGDIGLYLNRSGQERDILHEYFIPRGKLSLFIARAEEIVPRHHGELLNVTLREGRRDDLSLLRYATGDVQAVVMFFSQRPTPEEERSMSAMTRELIDAALELGGTYYLPYRLHASAEQFRQGYPACGRFFTFKRSVDPDGILRNRWSERYGTACSGR
jgi:FAD/FMN-containing dehydrogenase